MVGSPRIHRFCTRRMIFITWLSSMVKQGGSPIQARFTFDLIWPLAYLSLLVVLLSILYRVLPVKSRWRWVNLIPILGWVMDMLENIGASLIMYRYPERTSVLAELTPLFTLLKWCLIYAGLQHWFRVF